MASDEWVGIIKSASPRYLKGAIDLTLRERLMLRLLEQRGLIQTNYDGSHQTIFDVDYKEAPVEALPDGVTVSYQRRDYLKQGKIDWRGYVATDLFTQKEMSMTQGSQTVIVDRYKRIFPKLTTSVRNQLGLEFYGNGYAAGSENRFCGIESFLAAGTCLATDIIAAPNANYFGLSTTLHQSGRWNQTLNPYPNASVGYDWPESSGSSDFDYWSPKLVNWSSSNWGTGKTTWEDNCERVLRRASQWVALTSGTKGLSLYCYLAPALMTGFKNAMSAKLRILSPVKEAEDLGFPNTLNFEGTGITTEWGIPSNTGYLMNVDMIELDILVDELIKSTGPHFDPDTFSYKFAVYTYGNWRFLPKHVAKLFNYA